MPKTRTGNCKGPSIQWKGGDYLFALKKERETYLHIQKQITEVDEKIKQLLEDIIDKDENKKQHVADKKPYKRKNKNKLRGTDRGQISYKYFEGIDLMAIEGVNDATIMTIISEVGLEGIKKFDSAKQSTAWPRLSPNNKISGGKVLSHHIPKGGSRLKIALRNPANAIGNLKGGHLADFFRRII